MTQFIAHIRKTDSELQSLAEHLQNVSALAGQFAAKAGLPLSGNLAGLLHDLGKYSEKFQNYIKSAQGMIDQDHDDYIDAKIAKGKIDHSTAGAQKIWQHFEKRSVNLPYAQVLALSVASHHSGLIDCLSPEGDEIFLGRMAKADAKTHLYACLQACDAAIEEACQSLLTPHVMRELHECLTGIHKRVSALLPPDASKGDRDDNIAGREVQRGLAARFLLSCLLDADRIDSAEFEDPKYKSLRATTSRRPWPLLISKLESHLGNFKQELPIDALRREISDNCRKRASDGKGLFTLTVPTGGGKTLASLRFALHHAQKQNPPMERVIYVIPYTSIIDQNAKVARDILENGEEPGSMVLEHHSNILPDDENWRNKLLADNWEAPVVFTTMVQFLETLFGSGTRHARRMHNLADSVIIFDEIQTLPLRCMHLFCNALNFLLEVCGSSAVLCTATQPCLGDLPRPLQGQLALAQEREIMPAVDTLFTNLKRVDFFDHCDKDMSADDISALALEELHGHGSCLVVCNTKGWAEKIYATCREQWRGTSFYLSTNLCPAHRLEKLDAMRAALKNEDNGPVLCVSTQLIECGVDVSFKSVIRCAAGLDSILQAAGRCNRHGEAQRGRVHIVKAQDENLAMLKDILDGRDVYLLAVRNGCKERLEASGFDLNQTEIIEAYFKDYFHRRKDIMAYKTRDSFVRDDTLLNMFGGNTCVSANMPQPGMLRQSFASAGYMFNVIDTPTKAVLVPYKEGKEIIAELDSSAIFSRKRELLRAAQRYSVNVFPNMLAQLDACKAVSELQPSGILALLSVYYHSEMGVIGEPRGDLETCVW